MDGNWTTADLAKRPYRKTNVLNLFRTHNILHAIFSVVVRRRSAKFSHALKISVRAMALGSIVVWMSDQENRHALQLSADDILQSYNEYLDYPEIFGQPEMADVEDVDLLAWSKSDEDNEDQYLLTVIMNQRLCIAEALLSHASEMSMKFLAAGSYSDEHFGSTEDENQRRIVAFQFLLRGDPGLQGGSHAKIMDLIFHVTGKFGSKGTFDPKFPIPDVVPVALYHCALAATTKPVFKDDLDVEEKYKFDSKN